MLPNGVSPIDAGRLGLWLLSQRSHNAALKRTVFPKRDWLVSPVWRFARLLAQWKICEYPGTASYLSAVLGISHAYARNLLKPSATLPAKHARKMAEYLANHASQCDALAAELRVYADSRKFTNKPVARRRKI